jgi:asparagine synthase (glutamine-hydrolysing)
MCGIAGFVSLNGAPARAERIDRMIATLEHRGPDDRGLFTDGPAALGAARLSIIDVAGGHQPIGIGHGITVAQNGEIYNYVELRRDRRPRHHRHGLRHGSDRASLCGGRVGLQAHARHVAVAIPGTPPGSARSSRAIVSARSRCGTTGITTNFSSARDQGDPRRPRSGAADSSARAARFLTFGYVAGGSAIFEGMHRLEPRHPLIVDVRAGTLTHERYWAGQPESVDSRPEGSDRRARAELDGRCDSSSFRRALGAFLAAAWIPPRCWR